MKNGSNALPRKLACWPGVTLPSRRTCGYETNDGIAGSSDRREPGDRAAVGRIELLRVAEPDVVERRGVAGQAVIGRRVVVLHPVVHRADLREPVDHRGEPRQVLADRQARLAGGDRLELAANARRRVGLHVERVQVRRAAELVQEDDVLGPRRMPDARVGLLRAPAGPARRRPRNRPGAAAARPARHWSRGNRAWRRLRRSGIDRAQNTKSRSHDLTNQMLDSGHPIFVYLVLSDSPMTPAGAQCRSRNSLLFEQRPDDVFPRRRGGRWPGPRCCDHAGRARPASARGRARPDRARPGSRGRSARAARQPRRSGCRPRPACAGPSRR